MKTDVLTALQKRAEAVEAQAEFIMAKTRDWQVIKQFMSNRMHEIVLTPEQEKKMERYQFIYNELVSGKSTNQQIVQQVKTLFKIELSQAYEDMNAAREVFTSVININKQFELNLALELNTKYKNKAEAMGDLKALAAFEKNREKLIALLPDEESDPVDFEGHIYELTFDPQLINGPKVTAESMKKLLDAINAKRRKPIRTEMFEELESENIPENDS